MERPLPGSGHTSRLFSFTDKLKARIALLHFPVLPKRGTPNGQTHRQAWHPMHFSCSTTTMPSSERFFDSASRQAAWQAGSPQCMQAKETDRFVTFGYSPCQTLTTLRHHPGIEMVQALAGQFTGMALNASVCVKIKSELFSFHTDSRSLLTALVCQWVVCYAGRTFSCNFLQALCFMT